ncbi:DegT/DnrJ/EryC1/StrS family aminotransferase [Streptomyces sp. NPDC007206]|uniref:DegT/DnrJ/EryC1/StrS family aminotransferase n=1 Tax=Streptomyces sp. NPDC007206 TaxID=3154317 RepID=UPI0033E00049
MTVSPPAAVPFFPPDLFEADRAALIRLVREIGLDPEQRFILGRRTAALEELLRDDLGAADVVACSSGTSALSLVLRALDIGPGDEVIVPAFGCAPLAASVAGTGAVPVFADIRPDTLTMDPDHAEHLVTARTRVVMPAHMFSVMADMPRFTELARRHGLRLLEDSAVAQGGVLRGVPAGLWGEAGVYSFVQVKTCGMPGEGGVVVTRDAALGETVRMLRNHGQPAGRRFLHRAIGLNSRFDEIQAAFQLHRYAGFPARLARRAEIAAYYTERFTPLADRGVVPPPPDEDGRCFYVYTVLAADRDALGAYLAEQGVATHVYYPRPLPAHAAFAPYAPPGARWPRAEQAARRHLSLPVHHLLTDAQVEQVADLVCAFAHEHH